MPYGERDGGTCAGSGRLRAASRPLLCADVCGHECVVVLATKRMMVELFVTQMIAVSRSKARARQFRQAIGARLMQLRQIHTLRPNSELELRRPATRLLPFHPPYLSSYRRDVQRQQIQQALGRQDRWPLRHRRRGRERIHDPPTQARTFSLMKSTDGLSRSLRRHWAED